MIIFLWLVNFSFASQAVERLCFASSAQASQAISIISTILVKGQDQVQLEGQCLNVTLDESRGELFQRWVKTRLPHAQYEFSTLQAPVLECDMVIKKITTRNEQTQSGSLQQAGFNISTGEASGKSEDQSYIKVSSGKTAMLKIDNEQLETLCTAKGNGHFQLKFSLTFVPTPALPNLPPPPQQGVSLSTEIEAVARQDINLGQIIRDLRNKQSEINLPQGAKIQETNGEETTQWFLHIR